MRDEKRMVLLRHSRDLVFNRLCCTVRCLFILCVLKNAVATHTTDAVSHAGICNVEIPYRSLLWYCVIQNRNYNKK